MNWEKLTNDVVAAAAAAFGSLISERKGEHFYAFALYTDGDAWTILAAANSLEQHQKAVLKFGETNAQNVAAYKWSTGEWAYENWKGELFTDIYRDLAKYRKTQENTDSDYASYKNSVHECMITALKRLDQSGFFGEMRSSIVLFVSSTDNDETETIENYSAKELNSQSVYSEFIERFVTKSH
tara:strand:- start:7342 stop:7890 length:549 start_codon:yes stop_codon:yes gene_type:complete